MVLGRRKTSVLQDTLKRLRDFVNGLGGVPDARTDLGIKNSVNATGHLLKLSNP